MIKKATVTHLGVDVKDDYHAILDIVYAGDTNGIYKVMLEWL
jgi:hypothetical protein